MTGQRHIIKTQVLDMRSPSRRTARRVYDVVGRVYREKVVPVIGLCCDEVANPGAVHRFDSLCLDVGALAIDNLGTELPARVEAHLREMLREKTVPPEDKNIPATASCGVAAALSPEARRLELFGYFLRTGVLPWWADRTSTGELEENLRQLTLESPDELAAIIARIVTDAGKLKRLVLQFSDAVLLAVAKTMLRHSSASVFRFLPDFVTVFAHEYIRRTRSQTGNRLELWREIFSLIVDTTVPESGVSRFAGELLLRLSRRLGIRHRELAKTLLKAAAECKKSGYTCQRGFPGLLRGLVVVTGQAETNAVNVPSASVQAIERLADRVATLADTLPKENLPLDILQNIYRLRAKIYQAVPRSEQPSNTITRRTKPAALPGLPAAGEANIQAFEPVLPSAGAGIPAIGRSAMLGENPRGKPATGDFALLQRLLDELEYLVRSLSPAVLPTEGIARRAVLADTVRRLQNRIGILQDKERPRRTASSGTANGHPEREGGNATANSPSGRKRQSVEQPREHQPVQKYPNHVTSTGDAGIGQLTGPAERVSKWPGASRSTPRSPNSETGGIPVEDSQNKVCSGTPAADSKVPEQSGLVSSADVSWENMALLKQLEALVRRISLELGVPDGEAIQPAPGLAGGVFPELEALREMESRVRALLAKAVSPRLGGKLKKARTPNRRAASRRNPLSIYREKQRAKRQYTEVLAVMERLAALPYPREEVIVRLETAIGLLSAVNLSGHWRDRLSALRQLVKERHQQSLRKVANGATSQLLSSGHANILDVSEELLHRLSRLLASFPVTQTSQEKEPGVASLYRETGSTWTRKTTSVPESRDISNAAVDDMVDRLEEIAGQWREFYSVPECSEVTKPVSGAASRTEPTFTETANECKALPCEEPEASGKHKQGFSEPPPSGSRSGDDLESGGRASAHRQYPLHYEKMPGTLPRRNQDKPFGEPDKPFGKPVNSFGEPGNLSGEPDYAPGAVRPGVATLPEITRIISELSRRELAPEHVYRLESLLKRVSPVSKIPPPQQPERPLKMSQPARPETKSAGNGVAYPDKNADVLDRLESAMRILAMSEETGTDRRAQTEGAPAGDTPRINTNPALTVTAADLYQEITELVVSMEKRLHSPAAAPGLAAKLLPLKGSLKEPVPLRELESRLEKLERVLQTTANGNSHSGRGRREENRLHVFPEDIPGNADEIYIGNAGLVITWPFLSSFFNSIGLIRGNSFVDTEAAERAAHLLQYLADGSTETPEHELALNKVLCGIPLAAPLPLGFEITEDESREAASLLQAVIQNWPALGNISIDGFRAAFLLRQGVLEHRSGNWLMRVERQTHDILLDKLAWTLSVIKLPWLENIIYVEW